MLNDFKKYPVTHSLLLVTTLVYLVTTLGNLFLPGLTNFVNYNFGMIGMILRYDPSQLWRLVTPIFIHFGFEHFIFNAISIYFAGRIAEDLWGGPRFLLLYLLSGIMGNVFTFYFSPDTLAAGASTSIFGLFAAIGIVGLLENNGALKQISNQFVTLIVLNLIFNLMDAFSANPSISLSGHLGGALGGLLIGSAIPLKVIPSTLQVWRRLIALVAYLVITALLLSPILV